MSVFISHAEFDAEIAATLKAFLEIAIPGVEVFASSGPGTLQPGDERLDIVFNALKRATMLVILATERSLDRPWVWFEIGSVWLLHERLVIAVCLGTVRKDRLPSPLCDRLMVDGDVSQDLLNLQRRIGEKLGASLAEVDSELYAGWLRDLDARAHDLASQNEAGWLGARWGSDFLAFDGPTNALRMIEAQVFANEMGTSLRAAGFRPFLANPHNALSMTRHHDRGARIVYLTDRKGWRAVVQQGDAILMASPPDLGHSR